MAVSRSGRSSKNTPAQTAKSSTVLERPVSNTDVEPVSADAFALALNECRAPSPIALAVSGGPDSMTLMHLAARHARSKGYAAPVVFTVDHQLRPESAAEAELVKAQAHRLGLHHQTLVWHGPKPRANLQHAARVARYSLLGEAMRRAGVWALLTGHTLDDQAETFLMRLARGSGLDGLSGMAPLAGFPLPAYSDLCILRPLLGFTKAQILATARRMRAPFVDDPSNRNPAFARTRTREAAAALAQAGITSRRIAEAANHLRRARAAIDAAERALFDQAVTLDRWGYAVIDRAPLAIAPHEVGLRFTSSLLRLAGGGDYSPELDLASGVHAWLTMAEPSPRGRTAAGCRLSLLDDGRVLAAREQAGLEHDEPLLLLSPGQSGIWDGRFRVSVACGAPEGVYAVQALGDFAQSALKIAGFPPSRIEPRRIAATYPGLFEDGILAAVPIPDGDGVGPFTATFLGRTPSPEPGLDIG
jgi:tRNA(Ile)-lysidine synthase